MTFDVESSTLVTKYLSYPRRSMAPWTQYVKRLYLMPTSNLGPVVREHEAYLVSTQTLAAVAIDIDQAHSSTGECPTVHAQTSYGYYAVGDAKAVA